MRFAIFSSPSRESLKPGESYPDPAGNGRTPGGASRGAFRRACPERQGIGKIILDRFKSILIEYRLYTIYILSI
jgi:hypothetical protein